MENWVCIYYKFLEQTIRYVSKKEPIDFTSKKYVWLCEEQSENDKLNDTNMENIRTAEPSYFIILYTVFQNYYLCHYKSRMKPNCHLLVSNNNAVQVVCFYQGFL